MDTQQIDHALRSNPVTARVFRGVYAADQLPNRDTFELPSAYVANCSDSTSGGTHWIAFYQEVPGIMEVFDSYGQPVSGYNPNLVNFTSGLKIIQQIQQIQQETSAVCGQYALFFIFQRACGLTYSQLIHLFSDNYRANDKICCQFINQLFHLTTRVYDAKLLQQVAKEFIKTNLP